MYAGAPIPALDLSFTSGTLDPRVIYSGPSLATQTDATGKIVYKPHNRVTWSTDLTNAVWFAQQISVTPSQGAGPFATQLALFTVVAPDTDPYFREQIVTPPGATVRMSWYLKRGNQPSVALRTIFSGGTVLDRTGTYNFDTDTLNPAAGTAMSRQVIGNGIVRVSIVATDTTANNNLYENRIRPGITGSSTIGDTVLVSDPQIEIVLDTTISSANAVPGAYNPTAAAAYFGPRLTSDPTSLASLGLLVEQASTNGIRNSTMQGAIAADGVERITNGTFGGTLTGWTSVLNAGTGTIAASGNSANITGDGTHAALLTQSITTVIGLTYTITVSVATNAVAVQVGNSQGSSGLLNATAPVGAIQRYQFVASATTTWVGFLVLSAATSNVSAISTQSAGLLPTNVVTNGNSTLAAIVTAVGVAGGMPIVDIRFVGTAGAASFNGILLEQAQIIAASNAQSWAESLFVALAGGTTTNIASATLTLNQIDAGGALLSQIAGPDIRGAFVASLTRQSAPYTTNNASIAFVRPIVGIIYNAGAVDYTLRIAAPQMEQQAFATSFIPTYTAAVTRAADVATVALSSTSIPANPAALTIIGKFKSPVGFDTTKSYNPLRLDDGAIANSIDFRFNSAANSPLLVQNIRSSVSQIVMQAISVPTGSTVTQFWMAFAPGSSALQAIGQTKQTNAAATPLPIGLTTLRIGAGLASGTLNSTIARLQFFNSRLPDSQAAAIAAGM